MATKKELSKIWKETQGCYDEKNAEYVDGMSPEQELKTYQDGLYRAYQILTE